ncbi:MAG: uncharacterized protein QOG07_3012 [Pseudonocardiales bacterium]|nr:uncharacterized protein [Pseudonocardiales bacterium]
MREGPSDIAGWGLFATTTLAAGTAVSRVGGRLVCTAELHALIAQAQRDPARGYVDSIVVDEDVELVLPPRSTSRFGNHSCDPNLWWSDAYTLVAKRDIAAGEELTNDYATSTVDPGFLLRCHCESARCRGMITGDDWQIPELQARYDGHWVPMVQRRIDETR